MPRPGRFDVYGEVLDTLHQSRKSGIEAHDPRVVGTVEAIERELVVDGFVHRYDHGHTDDGLAGSEASFLMCSF